ncbi:hypothetical protein PAXRUDRAFT_828035, partial [Paxillus rubicundulus Ve08.2h10]
MQCITASYLVSLRLGTAPSPFDTSNLNPSSSNNVGVDQRVLQGYLSYSIYISINNFDLSLHYDVSVIPMMSLRMLFHIQHASFVSSSASAAQPRRLHLTLFRGLSRDILQGDGLWAVYRQDKS